MKSFLGFITFFTTLMVVSGLAGFIWFLHHYQKPIAIEQPTFFVVERGTGLNGIADKLAADGYIEHPFIFKIAAIALDKQSSLKAGEYELQPGMNMGAVLQMMEEGKVFARRITVPEGLTSFEVARLISTVPNLTQKEINIPAEGTLLPETYDYQKGETNARLLKRMEEAMEDVLFVECGVLLEAMAGATLADYLHFPCSRSPENTLREILILASIIEKETGQAEERRTVAGVFVNRLRKGMPLQTDPTVIYAITKGEHKNDGKGPLGRRLLRKDLQIDDPYNTYKYPGLPPGPIANPGRASIRAAIDPEEHDYVFFVADGTGGHLFAKTLKEHNQNVANWRKIRKQKNK